jgi:pullulanase
VPINLNYLSTGTGTGQINLVFDFSKSGVTPSAATLKLVDPTGAVSTPSLGSTSGSYTYSNSSAPVGSYQIFFTASTATQTAYKVEALEVFQGVTTAATLSLASGDFSASYIPVTSLSLNKTTASVPLGQTDLLTPTFNPGASNTLLTWTSSTPSVATVGSNGVVQTLSSGTTTITATSVDNPKVSASCVYTVTTPVITIHYKSSWSAAAPTIWVWELNGGTSISQAEGYTWPGPAMAKDSATDWWTWTIPAKYYPLSTGLGFKFAGGSEVDLTGAVTASEWYNGSAWSLSNPDGPTATANPGTSSFSTSTLSVTLSASNPATGNYTIDGGASQSFTSGQLITLGGSLAVGQSTTLVVTNGTASNTYTYTKAATTTFPDTLGALYTPSATCFRIWSPDSSNVSVTVNGAPYPLSSIPDFAGYTSVYQVIVPGDLNLATYQFYVNGTAVRDPYALMVTPGTTQGVVVNMSSILPTAGAWVSTPPLVNRTDAVIYEADVHDFTIDPNAGVDPAKRGKYLGMVQNGTTYQGLPTGIDHLKALGVTHVQLMPVFDFGSTMYNWGYDPVNYNVPEEQYAQATDPVGRIREFMDMVNGFHQNGLRVVMDVVYNHTYNKSVLSLITGQYYTTVDLSGCGDSLDDGNAMVSRMIRDSLEHWIVDYHIDGFRFDLMGVFYYTDVASWASYLNNKYPDRNLLFYGEPWNGGAADPADAQKVRPGKVPTLSTAHVGIFNGPFRDALRGGTSDTTENYIFNQAQDSGALWWGSIAAGMRASSMAVLSTTPLANEWDSMFTAAPEQAINYISCHDNLNLWDKINYSGATGGATGYAGRVDRFGAGIIFTSEGIPFIYEGDEFLHSKAYGGDYTTANNSYNAGDNFNAIHWADLVSNASTNQYYTDALALRKSTPVLRLTSWNAINAQVKTTLNAGSNNAASINCVNDPTLPANVVVSYYSSNPSSPPSYDTIVVYNPGNDFTLSLPAGNWTKVFDTTGAVNKTDSLCQGTAVTVFKKN